ncbi:MAG: arylsulfatase [Verrucomicrobia bacterium]|nr:arylsulfatase [Verrucomicrobiota bacterium]
MMRLRLVAGLLLSAILWLSPGQKAEAALGLRPRPNRPNLIFILADDLGYGDLGCYGQKRIKTPHIDKLAAEGMRFTSCYAGSTVCAPSRCALMTGLHTGHCRVRGNDPRPLQAEDVTVAEVLKRAGYNTGLIGKWGLGLQGTTGMPTLQGFDDFVGFLSQTHAHQYYPTNIWRNDALWLLDGNTNGAKKEYVHDLFTRAALNYVRVNAQQPFFLYLAYTIPHAHNELKDQGMEVPSDAPYSAEDWPAMEKNKAAMITRLDRDIGQLMGSLKKLKLDTNTVVFFTSDNGPHKEGGVNPEFHHSSGPLRGFKRSMYEGGIRVPMIVRWPGRIRAGSVSDFPWAFWDFLPTAAEIAGASVPADLDGRSVLPVLLGREAAPHEYFYWEFHEGGSKQAVRMGDWKAVRLGPGEPLELYRLNSDLGETNNVATQNPEVIAKVEAFLKTARTESAPWPLRTAKQAAEARRNAAKNAPVN